MWPRYGKCLGDGGITKFIKYYTCDIQLCHFYIQLDNAERSQRLYRICKNMINKSLMYIEHTGIHIVQTKMPLINCKYVYHKSRRIIIKTKRCGKPVMQINGLQCHMASEFTLFCYRSI